MIIITDKVHGVLIEGLKKRGLAFEIVDNISYLELQEIIIKATGLIVSTRIKVDKNLIEKGVNLKWVGRLGSGTDHIDVEHLNYKSIKLFTTPAGNALAVAEHTLGLMLNLCRNISLSYNQIKEGIWERKNNRGIEISTKKIGIIGFGNTGSNLATVLAGFNSTILVYDKYKKKIGNKNIIEVSLNYLLAKADIISLHLPLTIETNNFANETFFQQLKKKPLFISTCRGLVTNMFALNNALKNNLLSGAALDVLENEDLSNLTIKQKNELAEFLHYKNTIITPHIAGLTEESFFKNSYILLKKIIFL